MKKEEMPSGGLFERINAIRTDAILQAERERRRSLSGSLSALREQLPPCNVTAEQASMLVETYNLREQAAEIVRALFPENL